MPATGATLTAQQIELTLNVLIAGVHGINGTLTNLNSNMQPQPQPDRPTINAQLQTVLGALGQASALTASIQATVNSGGNS